VRRYLEDVRLAAMAVLIIFVCSLPACLATRSGSAEQQARTALNLYADLIDPVYEVSMQGCVDRQAQIVGSDLGDRTTAELDAIEAALVKPQARCKSLRESFELIRALHEHAREYVDAGKFDDALHIVDEIRQAWRELRERAGP
jgi:hypothetical protein